MNYWQWILVIFASLMIGMSRTVSSGLSMIFIPMMAFAFGGRSSLGVILPLLVFGDIFAVCWYRRQADFRQLLGLIPWTLAGMLAGLAVGGNIPDSLFKRAIALVVLVCLVLMFQQDRRNAPVINHSLWIHAVSGLLTGFTTMIGNASGPIMTVYLLSMGLAKNAFIGTMAWFFLAVNLLKLPLQTFFWKNIDASTLTLDTLLFPFVALGAFLGLRIAGKIPEKQFRILIYAVSVASVIILLA